MPKLKVPEEQDEIDIANSKSLHDFRRDFWPAPPSPSPSIFTSPKSHTPYALSLEASASLSNSDLLACFALIEASSKEDYRRSAVGWTPRSKMREMREPDMKYVLVREMGREEEGVVGFMSFMPTHEDGFRVLYLYEIHLAGAAQGSGLGKHLMTLLEEVAKRMPATQKTMLTVFRSNVRALAFYEKIGYVTDEYSPPVRVLRDGRVVEGGYVILKKMLE